MTTATDRRKVPIWRLLLLSTAGGAVDIGYAVEGGYAIPVIRGAGIPLTFATVALALSPVIGMLSQPFLGALSDQVNCYFGRRKPFIFLLSLTAIIGCAAPYSAVYLDNANIHDAIPKVFVLAFIILFDFSIGQLQLPSRAFLLDVLPISQSQTGNFIYTLVLAVYAAVGFFLGAVDWSVIAGEKFEIEHQAQVVFALAAVVIFASMMSTLCSIREERHDDYTSHPNDCSNKNWMYGSSTVKETSLHSDSEQEPLLKEAHIETVEGAGKSHQSKKISVKPQRKSAACCNFNLIQFFANCTYDVVSFIYYMSYDMWLLLLITLVGYLGEFSFIFGFTTFVGTIIYEGDPEADQESVEYELYAKGVRMGSLALGISTVVGGLVSLSLDYITKWIRLKTVFLLILANFVIATFLMILLPKIYYTMIFGLCYGPLLVSLSCFPFALIPVYEVSSFVVVNNDHALLYFISIFPL